MGCVEESKFGVVLGFLNDVVFEVCSVLGDPCGRCLNQAFDLPGRDDEADHLL